MRTVRFRRSAGASLVSLCLATAQPAAADCALLTRLADLPAQMATATKAEPDQAEAAMRALVDSQHMLDPETVSEIAAQPDLAEFAAPLMSYARTLQPVGGAALERDTDAIEAIARSYGVAVGSDLVVRLLAQLQCDHEPLAATALFNEAEPAPKGLLRHLHAVDETVPGGRLAAAGLLLAVVASLVGLLLLLPRFLKAKRRGPWRERRHDRVACRYATAIHYRAVAHRALFVDISRSGGQMITDVALASLQRVVVEIDGERVGATVKWCGEDFVGLQFETTLTPAQLAAVVPHEPEPQAKPPETSLPITS